MRLKAVSIMASLIFSAVSAQGQVNNWSNLANGTWKWETGTNWSLNVPPSISQSFIFITNGVSAIPRSRFVTIDSTTSGSFPATMSVSNLTVGTAPNNVSFNNLQLVNAGLATPLRVLNTLTITHNGALFITNSALRVDGLSGGVFSDDGVVTLNTGTIVATNAEVIIGNMLPGQLTVLDGTWLANDALVGFHSGSQGTLTIAGGTNRFSFILDLAFNAGSTGAVWMSGGQLIVTNSGNGIGIGDNGVGQMTISNGTCQTPSIYVAYTSTSQGTLTVAGGTEIVGPGGVIVATASGATGSVWFTGGQLIATNSQSVIGAAGVGRMTISNGTWEARSVYVAEFGGSEGTLTAAGGTSTITSNLVIGDCAAGAIGMLVVNGGAVFVINANHNAVLDVRDGTVQLNSGTLTIDRLVITNSCGHFVKTGGTLSITSTNLDPNFSAVGDGIPNGWKQQYGFDPFDPTVASADPDGDGLTNLQEYQGGSNPLVPAGSVAFGIFPNNATHSNASVAAAIANVPTNAGVVYDAIGQTNAIQVYDFNNLVYTGPVDVSLTLNRIRRGDWMPTHANDGGFFNFNPGELPNIPRKGNNYYMEFTVWFSMNITNTPDWYNPNVKPFGVSSFPGPMRLLIGLGGEVYFTGDHYGDGLQRDAYYVNPAPNPGNFRITSIATAPNDIRITWQTVGGKTNVLQATAGTSGSYSTNFTDISPIIIGSGGDLTNATYIDVGGATNKPARFYRVRLVP